MRHKKKEKVPAGDKSGDCDSYLSVPTPIRLAQNHPQILKKPDMTQKGHHGDYPMPQMLKKKKNLIYVFLGGIQIHSREGRRWA